MIEIEKRGFLTNDLRAFLRSKAKKIKEYYQMNLFCENSGSPGIVYQGKMHTMAIVLKRIDNQTQAYVNLKGGDLGKTARRESKFDFDPNNLEDLVRIFGVLGINGFCPRYYKRTDYEYDGMEISTKEDGLLADHFEVEIQVENQELVREAEIKMNDFFEQLGLKYFGKEEYEKLLLDIYNANPPEKYELIDWKVFADLVGRK